MRRVGRGPLDVELDVAERRLRLDRPGPRDASRGTPSATFQRRRPALGRLPGVEARAVEQDDRVRRRLRRDRALGAGSTTGGLGRRMSCCLQRPRRTVPVVLSRQAGEQPRGRDHAGETRSCDGSRHGLRLPLRSLKACRASRASAARRGPDCKGRSPARGQAIPPAPRRRRNDALRTRIEPIVPIPSATRRIKYDMSQKIEILMASMFASVEARGSAPA